MRLHRLWKWATLAAASAWAVLGPPPLLPVAAAAAGPVPFLPADDDRPCSRRMRCDRILLNSKDDDNERRERRDDNERDDDDDGWRRGVTTYYMSYEGGPVGAGGKRLVPFKSVAVPLEDFDEMEGRLVEIRGFGTYRVDDGCRGGGCKDFDIFVGDDADEARRLPNWKDGNIDIQYRWITADD